MRTIINWGLICLLTFTTLFFSCSQPRKGEMPISTPLVSVEKNTVNLYTKPVINVYVENSGSMNGYVKGVTEFDQIIYNYLIDIKNGDLTDELNLFYINSSIIPQNSDIQTFIKNLEPNTFKQFGGNLGTTDIADILKLILLETNDQTVSIFISDCIFSPGKNKDANSYLVNQQIQIKNDISEHIKKYPQTAFTVYRCISNFDGFYFDKEDNRTYINDIRPFYVWLIGDKKYLSTIQKKIPDNKFIGKGIQNKLSITNSQKVNYAIQPNSGSFKLDKQDPKTNIQKLKVEKNMKATFNVQAQLDNFLLSTQYLQDTSNYIINDKEFSFKVTNAPTNPFGYTHLLKFSTFHPKQKILSIQLKRKMPEWVKIVNDEQGIGINKNTIDKTYGIKYLIEGIYNAYTSDNDSYTEILININQ